MKSTKNRSTMFLAAMFDMALVLNACGQRVSGRYTRKAERISWGDSGFMSFEFDGGIAKIISGGHGGEVTAAPYKVSGKHITIEISSSPFILEIKTVIPWKGLVRVLTASAFSNPLAISILRKPTKTASGA